MSATDGGRDDVSTTTLGIEMLEVVGEISEPSEPNVKLVPTFFQATVDPVAVEWV